MTQTSTNKLASSWDSHLRIRNNDVLLGPLASRPEKNFGDLEANLLDKVRSVD
jgi:hypothetical protein